jgi:beta-lactamase class A
VGSIASRPGHHEAAPPPNFAPAGARLSWVLTEIDGTVRFECDADERFNAASTMKVAVMIAVFRLVDRRALDLDRKVTVATTFASAKGVAKFHLEPDDVDSELANRAGDSVAVSELVDRMITVSSNEASNLLLGLVGFEAVTGVLQELGARNSRAQRLFGDRAAQRGGATNEVTPRDLGRLMSAIGSGRAAKPSSCEAMVDILCRQQFRDEIPAGLAPGIKVANKTGWVEGALHDAAIVWPHDTAPFCLVVCTDGFPDEDAARSAIQAVAKWAWNHRDGIHPPAP